MPRQTYNRPDPVQLQPAASPIGTAVSVGRGMVGEDAATALARGLGSLNQGLQPFIMNRMDEETLDEVQRQQQAAELEMRNEANRKAFREAVVSGAVLPEQNPHKLRHMKLLAGRYDGEAYARKLEASQYDEKGRLVAPHRTADDLNAFLGEARKDFDAVTDPDMRAGFLAASEQAEARYKSVQQARRMQELEVTHQLVMEDATDKILKGFVQPGQAPDPQFYADASALLNSYADVEGPVGRTRMNEQFVQSVVAYAKATKNVSLLNDFVANAEANGIRVSATHKASIAQAKDSILDDSEREKSLEYQNRTRAMRETVNRVLSSADYTGKVDFQDLIQRMTKAYPEFALEVTGTIRQFENALNPPDEKAERAQAIYQESFHAPIEKLSATDPVGARRLLLSMLNERKDLSPAERARIQGYGEAQIHMVAGTVGLAANQQSTRERNIADAAAQLGSAAASEGLGVDEGERTSKVANILSMYNLPDDQLSVIMAHRNYKAGHRQGMYERFGDENRARLRETVRTTDLGDTGEANAWLMKFLGSGEIDSKEYEQLAALYADSRQARSLLDVQITPEYQPMRALFMRGVDNEYAGHLALLRSEAEATKDTQKYETEKARIDMEATRLWNTTTRSIADKHVALGRAGTYKTQDEMLAATRDEIRKWVDGRVPKAATAESKHIGMKVEAAKVLGLDQLPREDMRVHIKRLSEASKVAPQDVLKTRLIQLAGVVNRRPFVAKGASEPVLNEMEAELDLVAPRDEPVSDPNQDLLDWVPIAPAAQANPATRWRQLGSLLATEHETRTPEEEEAHHASILAAADAAKPGEPKGSARAYHNMDTLIKSLVDEKPTAHPLSGVRNRSATVRAMLDLKDTTMLGMSDQQLREYMVKKLNIPATKITNDHVDSFRMVARLEHTNRAIDEVRGVSVAEALTKDVDLSTAFIRASDRQLIEAMPQLAAKHYGTDKPTPDQLDSLYAAIARNRNLKLGRDAGAKGEVGTAGVAGPSGRVEPDALDIQDIQRTSELFSKHTDVLNESKALLRRFEKRQASFPEGSEEWWKEAQSAAEVRGIVSRNQKLWNELSADMLEKVKRFSPERKSEHVYPTTTKGTRPVQ